MTLWIDVEDLFAYGRGTSRPSGIQRLSFELYRALIAAAGEGVRFVRHDAPRGTMRVVDWSEIDGLYDQMIAAPLRPAEAAPPRKRPLSRGPVRHLVARLPPDLREAMAEATRSQLAVFRALLATARALPGLWAKPQATGPVAQATAIGADLRDVAQPGDVLACLGSPWFHPAYGSLVTRVTRPGGMRFAVLIYDLIPLVRPEFCAQGLVETFDTYARGCLPIADIILTISEATSRDVLDWSARQGIALRAAPVAVPIGTGFVPAPASALPAGLVPGGYALFVSTVEARKNHTQAFRLWRRLLEDLPPEQVPTLVFAGRVGWMVADLMDAIENTGWLGGKLVLVREPDDATLSALYANCRFTVFTSFYEGWGLPVSESLAFGKTCIASDRTSVPEAGGAFCLYVDPENTTAAYEVVKRAVTDPQVIAGLEARIAAEYRPTPWSATAQAVLAAVRTP